MHERLQHTLDEELTGAVVRSIPRDPIPDLAPAVLKRIRALQPKARKTPRLLEWIWAPRPVSLTWRPAYALAVAVLAIGIGVVVPASNPSPAPAQQVLVQFRLDAPTAGQVQLAGGFTNWKATVAMKRTGAGVWTVVLPLAPGVHNYSFVVDGKQWIVDPMAPAVSDGFGGRNSQLAVLTPDQGRAM